MTVRISIQETSCNHEVCGIHFNYGSIMQCIVMYVIGVC